METPSLRVRLVFEDRSILSKTQRSDGMNRSWLLIKPQQHRTISDVCTHLLHIFKLNRNCPNGILLAMEGFVLPPLESTEILKDKEIICVKKKGGAMSIEAVDEGNLLDDDEVDDDLLLLANDNFDKETGEYLSESEEVDEEQLEDEVSPEEAVSKKRKASTEVQNSKKKRRCLGLLDDAEDEAETEEIEKVNKIPNCKSKQNETNRSAETSNKKVKSPSNVKRSEKLQENAEEVKQASTAPGAKKIPSRSARRKKAKRRWMREVAKISKKKPHPHPKHEVAKAENKETDGGPKGLLHWKEAPKKPLRKKTIDQSESNQNGDANTQVVTRPGHIRFESLDEDQAATKTGVSNEALQWSKKKGQRWGTEKFSNSRRNSSKRINKEALKMLITDTEVPVIDPNDFDKLPPCCLPKEGDVIAYRLLELSSAWTPEFSTFRVGRILYYDARNIILMPVREYPIALDKIAEDGPNQSPYGEDGTLEINYSALVDVRNIKQYDSDAKKAVGNGVDQTLRSDHKDADENLGSNSNKNKLNVNPGVQWLFSKEITNSMAERDEAVNPWERFSKVVHPNTTDTSEPNHSSIIAYETNTCSHGDPGPSEAPVANKPKSPEEQDKPKGGSWDNHAKKADPCQDNNFHNASLRFEDVKKSGSSENDCENASSWGRPWSSFVPLRPTSINKPNKENDWSRGGSVGCGKLWARGAPGGRSRGRGRGRSRGRGRG